MSTYQKAREALGVRLRELRRDARLTGAELAAAHGWHRTKISKIESGKQTPSDADLEAWAASCGVPEQARELIAALRSLEGQYIEFRRMFRAGMAGRQRAFAEVEAAATFVRNFETCFVPGLLQTPEYARERLAEAVAYDNATDDLHEAVAARMARQQLLYSTGRRFHFVVTESVLKLRLCSVEVLAGQLEKLAVASTMRTIRLGVIPFEVRYPVEPIHGFHIFDDQHVSVETLTAELTITQVGEVSAYLGSFARLADVAVYGREARALIDRALDALMSDE
ncbi:helix-turn-helix transcriptional regulator [Streptosporangium sp. NPDC002524]|uniref:helix-turn-helix domain-containing protein n=1 Tax=Streptosporangium sp. NPDC002524 TaxID=3154537 RepID=UPI00332072A0